MPLRAITSERCWPAQPSARSPTGLAGLQAGAVAPFSHTVVANCWADAADAPRLIIAAARLAVQNHT